jgi:hypothetical protein
MVQLKYFGDRYDYFKYDLITRMLESLKTNHYVFIPMLTDHRNDNEGQTKPVNSAGKSPELLNFINECQSKSLTHWEKWLRGYVNQYHTIKPVDEVVFDASNREEYWKRCLPLVAQDNSLIFIDPDTGIELGRSSRIPQKDRIKYVMNDELKDLVVRIPVSSILMIYQHLQRIKDYRQRDFETKVNLLNGITQDSHACGYREGYLAFLFVSRSRQIYNALCACLEDYASRNVHPEKSFIS